MNNLLAQATEYELLAPLPGVTIAGSQDTSTFASYIPGIFNLIIGVAGVLAVIMIIWGGIQYMSTDAFQGKSDAKNTISNAIWGLILTISAWLILYTINPKLVELNLNIERAATSTSALERPGSRRLSPEEAASDSVVRRELKKAGFFAAKPCVEGKNTGCVNLNGLQGITIDGLRALGSKYQEKYPYGTITITGGTEGGHTTGSVHDQGRGVDLRGNTVLNAIILGSSVKPEGCKIYTSTNFAGKFLWEPKGSKCGGEVASSNDHWHVSY